VGLTWRVVDCFNVMFVCTRYVDVYNVLGIWVSLYCDGLGAALAAFNMAISNG
jgi:hypothetical protein